MKKLIEVALPLPEINDASAYDKMPGIGPLTLSPFFGQFKGFLKVDRKPASRDHFIHFGV
jgi:hypothetical protein